MLKLNRRSFLTRSALAGVSSVASMGLLGCGAGQGHGRSSGGGDSPLVLTADLAGQTITREEVLVWEARRLQVVADRMNGQLPVALVRDLAALLLRRAEDISNIAQERNLMADAKLRAGDAAMRQLVAGDLLLTNLLSTAAAAIPHWSTSEIDLFSSRGTAEGFAAWFTRRAITLDDQRSMLIACPDHYLLHGTEPSRQEVIEVTGGAVLASQFVIDYGATADLPIVIDPDFPVRFSGAAINPSGVVIGGTNHMMRTLAKGFQLHASIFFPSTLPFWFETEHRWHLACEFSNWIEAYIAETGD